MANKQIVLTVARTEIADQDPTTMPEQAEDRIIRNLIEALGRLHDDLDRVELWTAALNSFQHSAPEYRPGSEYLLPARKPAADR
jgi:hypothetical protein